jgi:hypothetical protein
MLINGMDRVNDFCLARSCPELNDLLVVAEPQPNAFKLP